ncbi:MAG: recombinase family protein [Bacteroidia bacterium]
MEHLHYFRSFTKGNAKQRPNVKTAVAYTRVSTKEQADHNLSLDTQKKHIYAFAEKMGLDIVKDFGGTYESAKTDERKEFQEMLSYAKDHRVGHILVYSLDRFSRSGVSGMAIKEDLKKRGILVTSIMQPTNAATSAGDLQQNIQMIFSNYENSQRREKSMGGTKEMLLRGDWPTRPPKGYDIVRQNGERTIEINEIGKVIRQAFKRKLKYNESFKELSGWMRKRGVEINHKILSQMVRNPFYCGLMVHSTLEGEIVQGNHQGLISQEEFLTLNGILKERHERTQTSNKKEDENLPLKGLLVCNKCGNKMTGYLVRAKNLYYYKCNKNGCRVNKSAKQLHQSWEDLLRGLEIDEMYHQPIIDEFNRTLKEGSETNQLDVTLLKKRATGKQKELDQMEERYALGKLSEDIFNKYHTKYQEELNEIQLEIEEATKKLSNPKIEGAVMVETLSNLLNMWNKGKYHTKRNLIEAVFPEGIIYDKQNNTYRTDNINCAIGYIQGIATDDEPKKKRNKKDKPSYSALVARSRIELPTSGL